MLETLAPGGTVVVEIGDDFVRVLEQVCGGDTTITITLMLGIFAVCHSGLASLRPKVSNASGGGKHLFVTTEVIKHSIMKDPNFMSYSGCTIMLLLQLRSDISNYAHSLWIVRGSSKISECLPI